MYLIILISAVWFVSELILALTRRSHRNVARKSDRSSLRLLWLTIVVCIIAGVFAGIRGIGYIPAAVPWLNYAGIVIILVGLTIRWLAILTLRRFFTIDVAIAREHEIIQKGLYAHIRHPSYTGSLLSFFGLGLAFANWLSTLIITAPILAAFLYRIKIEEAVMLDAFGEKYLAYCKHTSRLIPRIY